METDSFTELAQQIAKDRLELENRGRVLRHVREEKKALLEQGIHPILTHSMAIAQGIEPSNFDFYAVQKGVTVTTHKKPREKHPIGHSNGFAMLSRGQICDLLAEPEFKKSAAVQSLFLHIVTTSSYGGEMDPSRDSAKQLAKVLGLSRQQVTSARNVLYGLDVIRPRSEEGSPKCWVLNPAVAFAGDAHSFVRRESEYSRYKSKAPGTPRTRGKPSQLARGQRPKRSKQPKRSKKP